MADKQAFPIDFKLFSLFPPSHSVISVAYFAQKHIRNGTFRLTSFAFRSFLVLYPQLLKILKVSNNCENRNIQA